MKEVSYKIETLNLLNKLTSLCNSFIAKKIDDKLVINCKNSSETISYFLETDITDFNFQDDEIAFYDYTEFFQLISVFKEPKITQDNNVLIISKDKSKIKFVISDPETITSEQPRGLNIEIKSNCDFELSEEELRNLCKMVNVVNSDSTNLKIEDGKLFITLQNETHENTFERIFDSVSLNDENLNFNIPSEIFTSIPSGAYDVSIWNDGLIIFKIKSFNVNLRILTAELQNGD